jgi:hypothetical protein
MGRIVRVEKRKRGIFGWVFLLAFWAFNAIMAFGLFAGLAGTAEQASGLTSEAERAGHAIGTALGAGMIVSIWASGALILGLFVLLTRGKKTIIETTED